MSDEAVPIGRKAIRRMAIAPAILAWALAGLIWGCGIPSPAVPVLCQAVAVVCLGLLTLGAILDQRGNLLLLVLVAVLAAEAGILAADAALRHAGVLFYRSQERFARLNPEHPYLVRYQPGVRYEARTYGDLAAMLGDPAFREWRVERFVTDPWGFRNDPDLARSTNLEVVVVGDSFAAGTGTTQEKTWVTRLNREYGIPAYNLSQMGNPYDYCMDLKIEWSRLRFPPGATVLLALFTGNDLAGYFGSEFDPSKLPVNGPWKALMVSWDSFRNRSPLRTLFTRWYCRQGAFPGARDVLVREVAPDRLLFFRPYADMVSMTADRIRAHPNYGGFASALQETIRWCREKNAPLVVLILPSKEETYAWILGGDKPWATASVGGGFAAAAADLCRSHDVPCVDAGPYLRAAARERYERNGGWLWWRDDSHLNEEGHAVVAEFVARSLRELSAAGSLPLQRLNNLR